MSVGDLRTQLKSRGAPHKGLKSQLVARLTKLLKLEEQTEALKNEDSDNENAEGEDETEILLRSVKTGTQEDKDKEKKADKSEVSILTYSAKNWFGNPVFYWLINKTTYAASSEAE
nr:unnamed protein product [Callosobruchus chinensis]